MIKKIKKLSEEVKSFASNDAKKVEAFRIRFLGKKGVVPGLFSKLKEAKDEEKKILGSAVNQLKALAQEKITLLKNNLPNVDVLGPIPWPKCSGEASTIISWRKKGKWKLLRKGQVLIPEVL